MIDKPKLNFIIDALMFLVMMAMAGLGFLMKYVLIPGKSRWVKYGRNVDLTLLSWDRHDWGELHLYLGFTLLSLPALTQGPGMLNLRIVNNIKESHVARRGPSPLAQGDKKNNRILKMPR
jgi:hypothetical protein